MTESRAVEPKAAEPGDTKPKAAEPGDTKPKATEPGDTEPKATEPGDTEPKAVTSEAVARRRREAALAGHRGDTDTARAHLHDREAVVRCSALRALQRARDLAA
ncbi:MAG: hypothetical protein OXC58_08890, partial [Acidimicrobiaceae bacterium]|nr:hypothetical protein [Acidimicrobiaceae bacterium]